MRFSGAIERAVARIVALIPLLLVRNGGRDALRLALEQQLAVDGWADASSGCISSLKRDLRVLRELELVASDMSKGMPAYPGPRLPLWVTPDEARALYLGADMLDQLGLPEASVLQGLLARVPGPVVKVTQEAKARLDGSLVVTDREIWHGLQRAIATGRQVKLTYQKPRHDPETFVVDRAQMMRITNAWYFTAFRPAYAALYPDLPLWRCVREYRLDRIKAIEVLKTSVTLPELPFFEARIVLGPELRDRVFPLFDALGRPALTVQPLDDDTVGVVIRETSILRATQRISAYAEYLVRVEGPDELRKQLKAAFTRALTRLDD
jgi:predicted DNA-binding transcriptional regulator YafY